MQDRDPEEWPKSDARTVHEVPSGEKRGHTAETVEGEVKYRRLFRKTRWGETSFGPPAKELVTRVVAQGLKRKATAANRDQRRLDKKALVRAWSDTHANIEAVDDLIDNQGTVDMANEQDNGVKGADSQREDKCELHPTHRTARVGQLDAIYCTKCAAYTSRIRLKKLHEPCEGQVAKSSSRNYRLLQLGLLPGPGVRIPPQALRKRKRVW